MMTAEIEPYFSREEIEELARKTGFVKRSSVKLGGADFIDILIMNRDELKDQSLNSGRPKAPGKNVIPAKAGIQVRKKLREIVDSGSCPE